MKYLLVVVIIIIAVASFARASDFEQTQAHEQQIEEELYPGFWRCVASDVDYEEHGLGHITVGYNQARVYYRALFECNRFHRDCFISCVRG